MLLIKTDKARQELAPGMRTLSLRERSLLLLADGKPLSDLQAMYNGGGAQIVEHLLRQGYLAAVAPTSNPAAVQEAAVSAQPAVQAKPAEPEQPAQPADALRSLAGARMYLFDICERMFARRDPAMAQHFHSALRSARDRDSMLDVSESLLEEITHLAGEERAQSVRERMAQLLPREASMAAA